jgi:hypothetical protein
VQISGVYHVHSEDIRPLFDIADQLLDTFDTAHIRHCKVEAGDPEHSIFAALRDLAQSALENSTAKENEVMAPVQQGLNVLKVCARAGTCPKRLHSNNSTATTHRWLIIDSVMFTECQSLDVLAVFIGLSGWLLYFLLWPLQVAKITVAAFASTVSPRFMRNYVQRQTFPFCSA